MQTEPDLGALTPAASDPDADLAPELDRQIAEMPPRPRPRRMLVAAPIVLLVAGFGLQLVAWAVANPLAASPDEPAHFTKALGAAYGQWRGQPLIKVKPGMTAGDRFLAGTTSQFDLPLNRYIMRPSLACVVRDRVSAACQDDVPRPPQNGIWYTHVGTYQPFVYLPMGLAARTASDGELALRLARLADVAVCLALLGGAAFCAGTRWRLIGLLAAVTPMCLFMFASVTPNGPEIAGAVCFGAASLALVVGDQRRGTWIWWAVGGCVLALSKGLGPVWIAVHVVLAVLLVGPKAAARLAWSERRRAVPAVVAVAAAAVVSAWWDVAFMPHPPTDLGEVNGNIRPAVDQLPKLLREAIGLFGWLNAPLPRFLYVAGYALLVGLILLALWVGSWRERFAVAATVAVTIAATIAITAGVEMPIGFLGQARLTLAVAVMVPMMCGVVISANRQRLRARVERPIAALAVVLVVGLDAGAWWANSHRYAVGISGPWWFISQSQWHPPGGWVLVSLAAVLGALALAFGVVAATPRPAPEAAAAPVSR